MGFMSNKAKGKRFVSVRIALVLLLSIGAFGGTYMYLGGVKQMTTIAVAKATIPAGTVFDHTTMSASATIAGAMPGYAEGTVTMIDASAADSWYLPYDGKVLTNTIHPGDPIRVTDFYLPRETTCAADSRTAALATESAAPSPAASGSPAPSATPSAAPTTTPAATPVPTSLPGQGLSAILDAKQRALVITGDPTSTYVRPGDYLDIFLVIGGGGSTDTQVSWMMTRCVIYTIPRPAPDLSSTQASDYNPNGTSFVLDLSAKDVQDLLFAATIGDIRLALGSPALGTGTDTGRPTRLTTNAQTFLADFGIDVAAEGEDLTVESGTGTGGDPTPTTIPIDPLAP